MTSILEQRDQGGWAPVGTCVVEALRSAADRLTEATRQREVELGLKPGYRERGEEDR